MGVPGSERSPLSLLACHIHQRTWCAAQLMFKLRKELGDEDFKRIFDDARINGPNIM